MKTTFVFQITGHAPSALQKTKPVQTKTTGPDFNRWCWNRKVELPRILPNDFQWCGSAAGQHHTVCKFASESFFALIKALAEGLENPFF